MYRGIRSSRKLEEACHYRFDFIWLVEGRHIDHSTFATFRTKFREPLKDLFRRQPLGLANTAPVPHGRSRLPASVKSTDARKPPTHRDDTNKGLATLRSECSEVRSAR
jgi:hypothetical protein